MFESRVSFANDTTWGYKMENGSWSGTIGRLLNDEIDFGGTAGFIVSQRVGLIEYLPLYTDTK